MSTAFDQMDRMVSFSMACKTAGHENRRVLWPKTTMGMARRRTSSSTPRVDGNPSRTRTCSLVRRLSAWAVSHFANPLVGWGTALDPEGWERFAAAVVMTINFLILMLVSPLPHSMAPWKRAVVQTRAGAFIDGLKRHAL